MRRTLHDLLILAIAGCLLPMGAAWSRELPNIDALASVAPKSKAKLSPPLLPSVQRMTQDSQLGVANFVWLDPAKSTSKQALARRGARDIDPVLAAREEFKSVADLYGVTAAELDAAPAQLSSSLPAGTKLVRFTNQRDGIAVFRDQAAVLLNAQSRALNIGGYLGSTRLAPVAKSAKNQALSPAQAAQVALQDFEFGQDVATQLTEREDTNAKEPGAYRWLDLKFGLRGARGAVLEHGIRYRPVWFRMPQGLIAATYMELHLLEFGEHQAYSYVIAKDGGQVLFRNLLTSHQTAPAQPPAFTYKVWADPQTGVPYPGPQGLNLNPYPGNGPDGTSARWSPASRMTLTSTVFSRMDPWMGPLKEAATSSPFGFTYGNNVRAFADIKAPEGYSGSSPDEISSCGNAAQPASVDFYGCTSNRSFDFDYDLSADPLRSQGQTAAAVANMFYTLNWLHDWFYDAGFDEASGNAQLSNYGRGGVEGDPLSARALMFGTRNNASMDTPADGGSPVMRAMIYDAGNAPLRSAALDNTIVVHEWAHYLSRRLIGNANGLTTRLSTGLGEGWSDFVAQLITVTEQDRQKPGNDRYQGAYAQGAYANSGSAYPAVDASNATYFGARRYPYSTDMNKNPLTFKHIQDGTPLPGNAPLNHGLIALQTSVGQGNAEVHNVGEVWANMLWGCYAAILNQRDFADAKQRMTRYLVTGMKLTPINSTFIEARDALLAGMAASDSQDYAACLGAFAQRGAGLDAQAPDRNSIDLRGVVESYSSGPSLIVEGLQLSMALPGAQSCDADDLLDNGETAVLAFNVTNRGDAPVSGISLALQSDNPQLTFLNGSAVEMATVITPGQSLALRAPVQLSGMSTYANTSISVNIAAATSANALPVASRGQVISAWVNADIQPQSSAVDNVTVWPGGMALDGSPWQIAGQGDAHWYRLAVPNERAVVTMYTPPLVVGRDGDLVLSFDQEYDFGNTFTNGGQLVVSQDVSADVAIDASTAGYNGIIWWMRDGASNTNLLRGQMAYTGKTQGWKRDVTVNLGSSYAGKTIRLGWRVGSATNANADAAQFWHVKNIRLNGLANKPFANIQVQAKSCNLVPLDAALWRESASGTPLPPSALDALNGAAAQPIARTEDAALLLLAQRDPAVQTSRAPQVRLQAQSITAPTAVPTLSQWGLWLLMVAVGGAAGASAARVRRRVRA